MLYVCGYAQDMASQYRCAISLLMTEQEDVKILVVIFMLLNETKNLYNYVLHKAHQSPSLEHLGVKISGLSPAIQVIHIQEATWTTSKPNYGFQYVAQCSWWNVMRNTILSNQRNSWYHITAATPYSAQQRRLAEETDCMANNANMLRECCKLMECKKMIAQLGNVAFHTAFTLTLLIYSQIHQYIQYINVNSASTQPI